MSERHEEALALLHDICDLFGIGADARSRDVILTNVQNAKRRSECLNRVEWEFFTTTETDEDGWEYEECPLNWGANSQEYAEQLRAALSRIEAETEARVLESMKREPDGYAYRYHFPFGGEVRWKADQRAIKRWQAADAFHKNGDGGMSEQEANGPRVVCAVCGKETGIFSPICKECAAKAELKIAELRSLLKEARDLLRHTSCSDGGALTCHACSLEAQINEEHIKDIEMELTRST